MGLVGLNAISGWRNSCRATASLNIFPGLCCGRPGWMRSPPPLPSSYFLPFRFPSVVLLSASLSSSSSSVFPSFLPVGAEALARTAFPAWEPSREIRFTNNCSRGSLELDFCISSMISLLVKTSACWTDISLHAFLSNATINSFGQKNQSVAGRFGDRGSEWDGIFREPYRVNSVDYLSKTLLFGKPCRAHADESQRSLTNILA